jgi:hypothetical protein
MQAPHGCCRSHLSLATLSVHDFVMAIARTFGVCKGRRKAGLYLYVDLAADADVEHCRPWCDWIEALAELNRARGNFCMLKAELSPTPLSNSSTATSRRERSCLAAQTERQRRIARIVRPSDPPRRPSAVRAPPTIPGVLVVRPSTSARSPSSHSIKQISSLASYLRDYLAYLVAGAIGPCPKNYSHDSYMRPALSGRCPAACPALTYIASKSRQK